jgi:hypothetical protein
MPTTTTIPYPLESTPTGIVLYKNNSNLPQLSQNYSLKDSNGTTVSDIFNKLTPEFIDINSLITDSNFIANLSNVGQQAQNSYQAAPGETVTGYQGQIPNPTLIDVSMTAIDNLNGYIYAVCSLTYSGITLNIHYEDFDMGSSDYTTQYDYTATILLKIDKYYSTTSYLQIFDTSAGYVHMVVDPTRSLMYFLKANSNQKTIIDKMSLTNYSITNLYTTPDNYINSYGSNNTQVTPYALVIDSAGNLYVSQNGDGTILKVDPIGTAVVYALFEYSYSKYGYDDPNTQRTFKGRPQGLAFDNNDNLYVSDNGTMFQGGNRTYTFFSTPFIYKIPAGSSNGQTYDPDNALTGQNVFSQGGQGTYLYKSFYINPDNLGNLYIIPDSNNNLYVLNTTTLATSLIELTVVTSIIRDRDGNIYYVSSTYNNITRIATETYIFTNVFITDYQGQDSATLSLNNNTTNTVLDNNVVVYNVLSAPTYGEIKYYSSNGGVLLSNTQGTDFALSGDISNIISYVPNTSPNGLVGWKIISVDAGGPGNHNVGDIVQLGATVDTSANYSVIPQWGDKENVIIYFTRLDGVIISSGYGTTYNSNGSNIQQQYIPINPPNVFSGWKVKSINTAYSNSQSTPLYSVGDLVNSFDSNTSYSLYPSWTGSRPSNVICFKEDTKILCLIDDEEVYIPIQDLRKGILVKTLASGYLPIELIGHSSIYNSSNKERGIYRLYRCSQEKYPDLLDDLIITGCHSILEKDISEEQREKLIMSTGKIYITENRYRLLACLDDRTDTYEVEGTHKIWHFALENENNYSNYGVYANGGLVESCSKRMMKEYADMTLIE